MHRRLHHQLKKINLNQTTPPAPEEWQKLLEYISQTYTDTDQDRDRLERSLNISSYEMQELYDNLQQSSQKHITDLTSANEKLLQEIVERERVEVALQEARDELELRVERRTAELKTANEQLATLYKIGQTITVPLSLEQVLGILTRNAADLLGTETSAILLLDEANQTLTIKGAYGLSKKIIKHTRLQIGESISGRVVQHGKPIIANDLPDNPFFYNPAAKHEGLLAFISVPLIFGDKIIGTLDVHSKQERQAFTQEHIELLNLLANQAAIAIENARLYNELQTARDELELRVQQRTAEITVSNEQLVQVVAELKQADEALRRQRAFLRQVIDINPHFIFAKDRLGRFTLANEAFAKAYRTTVENLIGKTDADFNPNQEMVENYNRNDMWVIETGQELIISEEKIVNVVGEEHWRYSVKRPIADEDGIVQQVLGIVTDITDRKRAEEALRESEERFRHVVTSISDHIYMTEITKAGQRINHYLSPTTPLTGYPLEIFLNDWSFWPEKVIYPDDRATAEAQMDCFLQGESNETEYRMIRSDGEIIWIRDSGRVEKDPDSGSLFIYGIVSDITARKQAEERLRKSEAKNRALLDAIPDVMFQLDREGTFLDFKSNKDNDFYVSPNEFLGKNLDEIFPPQLAQAFKTCIEQAEQSGHMQTYEYQMLVAGSNTPRNFEARLVLSGENEAVTIVRDITKRKEAEQMLIEARDQALAASRLKTELLAKVSHELRTPLGAILGYTEMLEYGIYGPLTDEQHTPTSEIIDSTKYLTNLVNELLDQAQLEAGKLKLNIGDFNPVKIVETTISTMQGLAKRKDLTLTANIATDIPNPISGDSARIQQILTNLAGNAIKFTHQGSVQVRLYQPDTTHWALQVCDTGPGIPSEDQARIFEPFGQVDGSMTRQHEGTGLGLSIVTQLVRLMNGEITLESELEEGSTFTVLLPLQQTQEKAA